MAINVVTAVLIIACPCALALSAPFAFGNILRIFGYKKFYLKNADTIESLARIDTIIFDKTGTITSNDKTKINYKGEELSLTDVVSVKKVLRASNHPLSRTLYDFLPTVSSDITVDTFEEVLGTRRFRYQRSPNIYRVEINKIYTNYL